MEELDIKEIGYSLLKNIKYIIVVALVGMAVGLLYNKLGITPMYKSSTSLVLSKPISTTNANNQATSGAITQNDVVLNQKLVSTYGEIIKSRAVAKEVIAKLGLQMSEDKFVGNTSVNSKKDTELLEISVSNGDPQVAADIANTLAKVFATKVKEVYNIENVSVIDVGEVNPYPYNVSMFKTIGIFTIGSILIACFVIFLGLYFNNKVRTQEDIEKLLDVPVLAIIPKLDK